MLHALLLTVALSPYLASHSGDAVKWNAWGDAAIARAKREQKPIFLSIGYASCHWCHVMQRESFTDADVAKILNERFVPVLVDREEHPDVDAAFMTYVELLNNGAAGWPANLVLTPELEPLAGTTYLPRAALVELLEVSSRKWSGDRVALRAEAASVIASAREFAKVPAAAPAEALTLAAFVERARAAHDATNGGFGSAPKFPQPLLLEFLLRDSVRTNDASLRELTTGALDAMAAGAIFDSEHGGFHRYATDAAWQKPHYEKMLYDQALLASDYVIAFQLTGVARYRDVARQTLDFTLRELRLDDGGFASSLDADSRSLRDDKVIAAWNGLAISALARGGAAFDEPRYLDAAANAARFIETKLWNGKRLARRWHRGDVSIDALAEDYAAIVGGVIDLYESGGDPHWLAFATQLQKRQDALFARNARYVTGSKLPAHLADAIDESDLATPSANSQSAMNLLRLGDITDNAAYRERAARIIETFSSRLANGSMPALASALSRSLTPERQLMIAGDLRDAKTRALLRVAHERFHPNMTILFKRAPRPAAYLCEHYVCKLPIYEPAELASALAN
ncbi:MAG TPA: thioredoxin domain-containing protein [Thermoanaerobaculia bacterium]|nr:thioredoxin domain-containing protein [Thermoanaerobaculia bacterium]